MAAKMALKPKAPTKERVNERARDRAVSLDQMIADMSAPAQREIKRRSDAMIAQHVALRELRTAVGKTQETVATALKVNQANVARLEARTDMLLSTLRGYVRAMGGDLRLVIDMPGVPTMELAGLGDLASKVDNATKVKPRARAKVAA